MGTLFIRREVITADIFIFLVDIRTGSFFSVVLDDHLPNLQRGFANGSNPCYFSMKSKSGQIAIAEIYINSLLSAEDIDECIYEELTQAFGLVDDSQGTPYFTYDNLAGAKPGNRDWKLLKALYDPHLKPGDPVSKALELYRTLPENYTQSQKPSQVPEAQTNSPPKSTPQTAAFHEY